MQTWKQAMTKQPTLVACGGVDRVDVVQPDATGENLLILKFVFYPEKKGYNFKTV